MAWEKNHSFTEPERILRHYLKPYQDEERKFKTLSTYLQTHIYSIKIQELDGTTNIIEDYKSEFANALEEYKKVITKISKLKSALYEKKYINIEPIKLLKNQNIEILRYDFKNLLLCRDMNWF